MLNQNYKDYFQPIDIENRLHKIKQENSKLLQNKIIEHDLILSSAWKDIPDLGNIEEVKGNLTILNDIENFSLKNLTKVNGTLEIYQYVDIGKLQYVTRSIIIRCSYPLFHIDGRVMYFSTCEVNKLLKDLILIKMFENEEFVYLNLDNRIKLENFTRKFSFYLNKLRLYVVKNKYSIHIQTGILSYNVVYNDMYSHVVMTFQNHYGQNVNLILMPLEEYFFKK